MKISIIIPLHIISQRFEDDLKRFADLDYPDYEILIICDKDKVLSLTGEHIRVINTGRSLTGPAEKRDQAINEARGEICAFIDDDAYPDPSWLAKAMVNFKDPLIGAVGGPGLTPPEDGFWEKAGGAVYESYVTSGRVNMRFLRKKKTDIEDWPAYNFLMRRDLLLKVKGFNSSFYGGEDTKICLAILEAGQRIVYDPDVIVYHHRRPLFQAHLKQVANVACHRGYFVKAFPKTSFRIFYFIPLLICEFLILLTVMSFYHSRYAEMLWISLGAYYTVSFFGIRTHQGLLMRFVAALGGMLTHIVYGLHFLKGLFKAKMVR